MNREKIIPLHWLIVLAMTTTFPLSAQQLLHANKVGSNFDDVFYGSALDQTGNHYITGRYFNTTDFDPSSGTNNLSIANFYGDLCLAKYDIDGNFLWVKQLAGDDFNEIKDITLDDAGSIYITGTFQGNLDFDPSISTHNLTALHIDMFVAKFNPNGELTWVNQYTGVNSQRGEVLTVDAFGNVVVGGSFDSNEMQFTSEEIATNESYSCAFVLRLDGETGNYVSHIVLPSEGGSIYTRELESDDDGNILLFCSFTNTFEINGISSYYSFTSEDENTWDALLLKINGINDIVWADQFHTFGSFGFSQLLFEMDRILLCGAYSYITDFDPGIGTEYRNANMDDDSMNGGFLMELNSQGELNWIYTTESESGHYISCMSADVESNIIISGPFSNTIDFEEGYEEYNLTESAGQATFLVKLNPMREVMWSKQINSNLFVSSMEMHLDSENNIHLDGVFQTTTSVVSFDSFQLTSVGMIDNFMMKFRSTPEQGDINADGLTNINDLNLFMSIFGCEDCDEFNLDQIPGITTSDLYIFLALLDL